MKKIWFVLTLFISSSIFSQVSYYYYYEVPSGTTNNLYDIKYFIPNYDKIFYICGDNGTLLKITSADSGCFKYSPITSVNLNGVLFPCNSGSLQYHVFGDNGLLIKSTNIGVSWLQEYTGFTNNLNSGVLLYGTSIFRYKYLAVGTNGLIIKKKYYPLTDSVWTSINSGTTNDLKSICTYYNYNVKQYVWIAGANGTILKSNDTGNTWYQLPSGTTNNLNSISLINLDTGFIVGDGGIILKTVNGGTNWNQKTSNTTQNLNCISYLNDTTIYIAGNKVVLYSTNKGDTWVLDTGVPQYNFYSCNFIYSNYYKNYVPFFVGEAGKIFKKTLDTTFHPNIDIKLDANNISAYYLRNGVLDQNLTCTNCPGFEWPKGSGNYAIFTAGLCIGAYVNNQLREAMASYSGEYRPGYCENGNYKTSGIFKYYKISKGDNAQNNWDWANWGLMVPYGAPFIDVNHNGLYEPAIDTPGVSNAAQTIFYCMTDADSNSHFSGTGFGGGTFPLGAEVHLTAWVYNTSGLEDIQFINYEIINKSNYTWNRTQIGIFSDPDLGGAFDDYTGCDTSLKLAFCYNSDNYDEDYGANPPAVGITLLTSPINRSITPNKILGMTSSVSPYKSLCTCEGEYGWYGNGSYLTLSGYKNDSTSYVDPSQTPYAKTKLCYSGEPETNTGWTRLKGCVLNCNLDSTGTFYSPAPIGDLKMIFSSGADDFSVASNDTQKFVIAQLIARGTNNLNSVTALKSLCSKVRSFYNTNFPFVINPVPVVEIPQTFLLEQNYPNPFNPTTNIKYKIAKDIFVTLKIYDILGREVEILVNEFKKVGVYETQFPKNSGNHLPSGIYFCKIVAGDYTAVKRMVLIK